MHFYYYIKVTMISYLHAETTEKTARKIDEIEKNRSIEWQILQARFAKGSNLTRSGGLGDLFVFVRNFQSPLGYKVMLNNSRDGLRTIVLPHGFYTFIETKGGHILAMRSGFRLTSHPNLLCRCGFVKTTGTEDPAVIKTAGELYVDPQHVIIMSIPQSGNYYGLMHDKLEMKDGTPDTAKKYFDRMFLPAVTTVRLSRNGEEIKALYSEEVTAAFKTKFKANGRWINGTKKSGQIDEKRTSISASTLAITKRLNDHIFIDTERYAILQSESREFLDKILEEYDKYITKQPAQSLGADQKSAPTTSSTSLSTTPVASATSATLPTTLSTASTPATTPLAAPDAFFSVGITEPSALTKPTDASPKPNV